MSRDLATPCPSRPSPRQPAGLYHVIGNVWEWTHDYWTTRHRRSQEPRKARPGHVRDPSMTRPKGAARRCSRTRVGRAGRPGRRVRCPTASRRAAPSSATPRTASATASPRARKTPRTRAHHSCAPAGVFVAEDASRAPLAVTLGTSNLGIRCARSAPPPANEKEEL